MHHVVTSAEVLERLRWELQHPEPVLDPLRLCWAVAVLFLVVVLAPGLMVRRNQRRRGVPWRD